MEEQERDGNIFFYNPHNFWAYMPGRRASEDAYYAHFAAVRRHAFFVVGGITEADRQFKRTYQHQFFQIDARPILQIPRTNYITLIGDMLISVRVPEKFAHALDDLYASGRPVADLLPDIVALCKRPGAVRCVLEHSAIKAKRLRKMLSQGFWRPE
jgi:hypothetical protein